MDFTSYNKETAVIDNHLKGIAMHHAAVMSKLHQLRKTQTVNRVIAAECAMLLPATFEKVPMSAYTTIPSRTQWRFTAESLSAGGWALAIAASAAVAVLAWKLYHYLAKKFNWPTFESEDSKGEPSKGGDPEKTSQAAETQATAAIENQDVLTGEFKNIIEKLGEVTSLHDGLMVIKDNTVDENFNKKIDRKYKNQSGVQITTASFDDIALAMIKEESQEANILTQEKKTSAIGILKLDNSSMSKIINDAKTIQNNLVDKFIQIKKFIEDFKDINYVDAKNANTHVNNLKKLHDALNNTNISQQVAEIKKNIETAATNSSNKPRFNDVLKVVASPEYNNFYDEMQQTLFVGDKAVFRLLGETAKLNDDFNKMLDDRYGDGKKNRANDATANSDDVERDALSEKLMSSAKPMRTMLANFQHTLSVLMHITTDMHWLNRNVGRLVIQLIETLNKIYTDNGKRLDKMKDLSDDLVKAIHVQTDINKAKTK